MSINGFHFFDEARELDNSGYEQDFLKKFIKADSEPEAEPKPDINDIRERRILNASAVNKAFMKVEKARKQEEQERIRSDAEFIRQHQSSVNPAEFKAKWEEKYNREHNIDSNMKAKIEEAMLLVVDSGSSHKHPLASSTKPIMDTTKPLNMSDIQLAIQEVLNLRRFGDIVNLGNPQEQKELHRKLGRTIVECK